MGAKAAISAEEYLHTSFPDLDREYRDGEVLERTMPDALHGTAQGLLCGFFVALRKKLSLYVLPETRMKLREGLYLIPDSPPLIAIEILSPDDRLTAVREKLQEYRAWGVAHVWLVDPHSLRLYTCDTGLTEVNSFSIPELSVELGHAEIFD